MIYSLFFVLPSTQKLFFLMLLSSALIFVLFFLMGKMIFDGEINDKISNNLLLVGFLVSIIRGLEFTATFFILNFLFSQTIKNPTKKIILIVILYPFYLLLSGFLLFNLNKDGYYLFVVSTLYFTIYIVKNIEMAYWLSTSLVASFFLSPTTFVFFTMILFLWFVVIFKMPNFDDSGVINRLLKKIYTTSIEPKELDFRIKNEIKIEWKMAYVFLSSALSVFLATNYYLLICKNFWLFWWGIVIQSSFALIGFFVAKIKYHEREEINPTETSFLEEITQINQKY